MTEEKRFQILDIEKDIRKLMREKRKELIEQLLDICDYPEANQLLQRLKDIDHLETSGD